MYSHWFDWSLGFIGFDGEWWGGILVDISGMLDFACTILYMHLSAIMLWPYGCFTLWFLTCLPCSLAASIHSNIHPWTTYVWWVVMYFPTHLHTYQWWLETTTSHGIHTGLVLGLATLLAPTFANLYCNCAIVYISILMWVSYVVHILYPCYFLSLGPTLFVPIQMSYPSQPLSAPSGLLHHHLWYPLIYL